MAINYIIILLLMFIQNISLVRADNGAFITQPHKSRIIFIGDPNDDADSKGFYVLRVDESDKIISLLLVGNSELEKSDKIGLLKIKVVIDQDGIYNKSAKIVIGGFEIDLLKCNAFFVINEFGGVDIIPVFPLEWKKFDLAVFSNVQFNKEFILNLRAPLKTDK